MSSEWFSQPQTLEWKIISSTAVLFLAWLLSGLARFTDRGGEGRTLRARFWIHQVSRILIAGLSLAALLRIWITKLPQSGSVVAVMIAGLTVALQRVVIALAGYFSILRGNTFSVGDRITMGGVRGDVVALSFLRTTIMEMGQPPEVKDEGPDIWISGRQYTGRLVTITNDKIFDTPVYNYTRQFPFVWEEIRLPIKYSDDWRNVERMLIDVAVRHTTEIMTEAHAALPALLSRFTLFEPPRIEPATFVRITDNWVELNVRFIARDRGIRDLKSEMSRDIPGLLAEAKIEVASTTVDIVGIPKLTIAEDASRAGR
jgi:small-conductance mechanosensitive channel